MRTGGSNYIKINGSMENPVIGTFHLFAEQVAADLQNMFEYGQRQITLVCWYLPGNFPAEHDHLWHHTVDSYGGALCEQHQQNVIGLLALINELGFTELHFRFGAQGAAQPSTWTEWENDQFVENWNFVNSTRNLVDANKGAVKVVFDLGVEQGNERINTDSIHLMYCRRMWKNYTDAHGPNDSCSFSLIHGGAGANAIIQRFKVSGLPMPACYCVDAYEYAYVALTGLCDTLTARGELAKPVYLQETFYNDVTVRADVDRALSEKPMNFQGLFQWPVMRGHDPSDFPDIYPRRFDNYLVQT